jgi:hypothetical protein
MTAAATMATTTTMAMDVTAPTTAPLVGACDPLRLAAPPSTACSGAAGDDVAVPDLPSAKVSSLLDGDSVNDGVRVPLAVAVDVVDTSGSLLGVGDGDVDGVVDSDMDLDSDADSDGGRGVYAGGFSDDPGDTRYTMLGRLRGST